MAVTIEYNIVQAHLEIDKLRRKNVLLEQGLRDYAEAYWWTNKDRLGKDLERFLNDTVSCKEL